MKGERGMLGVCWLLAAQLSAKEEPPCSVASHLIHFPVIQNASTASKRLATPGTPIMMRELQPITHMVHLHMAGRGDF